MIVAIGMGADTARSRAGAGERDRTLQADPATLADRRSRGVFAAGDVVAGPDDDHRRGRPGPPRRAHDRPLPAARACRLEAFDERAAGRRARGRARPAAQPQPPRAARREPARSPPRRPTSPSSSRRLTEDEARAAAGRCLDCGVCSECHECVAACPADAIDLDMRERGARASTSARSIVSTGYTLFPADSKPQYGYGRFQNVITGMQMERLLAPTRPYNTVLRPSDGKVPERIAYVMCTGSRDETVGNPLCSKFCCMYSIKQNQLIMGALPLADVTVHYIDIRAVGQGLRRVLRAGEGDGREFVKGRVASIAETEDGNLDPPLRGRRARRRDRRGRVRPRRARGRRAAEPRRGRRSSPTGSSRSTSYDYVDEPDEDVNPGATSIPGVFVAGAASGAKDIPESILHAGAAVAQAAAYLERAKVPA